MLHTNRPLSKHLLFPAAFPKEIGTELGTVLADLDIKIVTNWRQLCWYYQRCLKIIQTLWKHLDYDYVFSCLRIKTV